MHNESKLDTSLSIFHHFYRIFFLIIKLKTINKIKIVIKNGKTFFEQIKMTFFPFENQFKFLL